MKDYQTLEVWRRSHQFVLEVYRLTRGLPAEEKYGLSSQLRRSASSIPANIAEGCGRSGDRELARFVEIAHGSASETEYHLLLAHDLNYIASDIHGPLADEIEQLKRMLGGFIRRLRASNNKADS